MQNLSGVERVAAEEHVRTLRSLTSTSPQRDEGSVYRWLSQQLEANEWAEELYYGPCHEEQDVARGYPIGISLWLKRPGRNEVDDRDTIGTVDFFFKRGKTSIPI